MTKRFPDKLSNIEISTTIGCRLNCKYCPQDLLIKRYGQLKNGGTRILSYNDFVQCLDKLLPNATITFSGMSEPFQNRNTSKMIKKAFDTGRNIQLFTTLVGMTEDDFELIRDVKFSIIVLHIPDEERNAKFDITNSYMNIFYKFISHFNILYYSCHGNAHPQILKYINKNTAIISEMKNRAGHIQKSNLETYRWVGEIVCTGGIAETSTSATGFTPMLLPNGTLIACCNDYGLELVLGNLFTDSWETILNGEIYRNLELAFEDDTIPIICRKCNRVCKKEEAIRRGSNYISNNAIKVGRAIEILEESNGKGNCKFNCLDGHIKEESLNVMNRLISAKNVCIFGLGKLFHDNYFKTPWHNVVQANVFSDNNKELWGRKIEGIECLEPVELRELEDLLIVIYVTDDTEICRQLSSMGLNNYINIMQIFTIFD